MEMLFVGCFEGNASAAAKKAGYQDPKGAGSRLMKRPEVREALKKKQDAMAVHSGKRLAVKMDVSRNEIIMGLAKIARKGKSVAAWAQLAEIFMLKARNLRDLSPERFAGWTDDELDSYAKTGEIPERIESFG
jgi:hypothetical protein